MARGAITNSDVLLALGNLHFEAATFDILLSSSTAANDGARPALLRHRHTPFESSLFPLVAMSRVLDALGKHRPNTSSQRSVSPQCKVTQSLLRPASKGGHVKGVAIL